MLLFCLSVYSHAWGTTASDYTYRLAICTVFRDDAPYLEEWIEFHRLVGVEHFYLYNHLSKDNFAEVLDAYISEGIVEVIEWPHDFPPSDHQAWIKVQTSAYNHSIENNREKCRWIAFIDTDEFLFPCSKDSLIDFLKDYEKFGGLCVSWRLFGTSFVPQIFPGELMIEKLIFAGDLDYHCYHKSIVQPRYVDHFEQVHSPIYFPPYLHVNSRKKIVESNAMKSQDRRDLIRINHYWTRDENYFYNVKLPCRKRRGWSTREDKKRAKILNAYFDNSIYRFITPLRERMEKRWQMKTAGNSKLVGIHPNDQAMLAKGAWEAYNIAKKKEVVPPFTSAA